MMKEIKVFGLPRAFHPNSKSKPNHIIQNNFCFCQLDKLTILTIFLVPPRQQQAVQCAIIIQLNMWGGGGYVLLLRKSLLLKHAMPSMLQSASTSTSLDSSSSTSLTAGAIAISASVAAVPSQKASIIGHIHPTTTAQPVEAAQPMEEAMSVGTSTQTADFPEAPIPELCCGSGCPNCIYIQYAEDVLNYVKTLPLHDGIVDKQKKLIHDELKKNVQDDNLRMFLQMEIDAKGF